MPWSIQLVMMLLSNTDTVIYIVRKHEFSPLFQWEPMISLLISCRTNYMIKFEISRIQENHLEPRRIYWKEKNYGFQSWKTGQDCEHREECFSYQLDCHHVFCERCIVSARVARTRTMLLHSVRILSITFHIEK